MKTEASVLFIPKWFPGKNDPQNGVFLLRYAEAVAIYQPLKVMHLCSAPNQSEWIEMELEQHQNLEILHVYYKAGSGLFFKPYNLFLYCLAFFKAWGKLYPNSVPKLVHAHVFSRPVALAWFIKKWKGIPFLITEVWGIYLRGIFDNYSFIRKVLMRSLAKKSSAITAVSDVLLSEMVQKGIRSRKMQVVGNAVPTPKAELPFESEKKIGIIADFDDANKRISTVIRVFSDFAVEYPEWSLHIIGGGDDDNYLRNLAKKTGLKGKQIIFHGRQDNAYVYQLMEKLAFVVNYSLHETFSVVLVEAILHGKPVISARCGGPESFVNEENGILIEKKDYRALRTAIIHMIRDYKKYDPHKIRNSIGDQFSPENIGRQFYTLYSEILNSK